MKIAAIQMTSGPDIQANLEEAGQLIRKAAGQGASFIATPEVTDQVIAGRAEKIDQHFPQEDHPGLSFFSALAGELSVSLLIGSMCVRVSETKLANRSFLFAEDGALKATYDKMHLFDVDLPNGESHRESDTFLAGRKGILTEVQGHRLGLSICYDMRFPYLFRSLAKAGAEMIAVPSAFTVPTGKAHWHVLLRARAIESGCFIIAPAQVGDHAGVRKTYGHSVIISPWGEILAEAESNTSDIIYADLDFKSVSQSRSSIPCLLHDIETVEVLIK